MARAASLAWLLVAAAVFAPAGLSGQAFPVTPVFEIAPPEEPPFPESSYTYEGSLSAVPVGAGWAVAWSTFYNASLPREEDSSSVEGRLVSTAASLGPRFVGGSRGYAGGPRLVPTARSGFAMAWGEGHTVSVDVMLQRWASGAVPLQEDGIMINDYHDYAAHFGCSLAVTPSGRFVVAWTENLYTEHSATILVRPWMRVLDRTGEPVTEEIEVAPPFAVTFEEDVAPEVLVDTAGRILAVWFEPGPAGVPRRWWGRHFRTDGTPLGERFLVADAGRGEIRIAKRAGGGFTALWAPPVQEGIPTPWLLRRFRFDGSPLGAPVVAGPAGPFGPQLAVDRHGNFAVVGQAGEDAAVFLFNSYLAPQGGPVRIGVRPEDVAGPFYSKSIAVSLHDGGRFLASWINGKSDSPRSILGRIWETVRDDDVCVYRGNRFFCDTGADGGALEPVVQFGDGHPGVTPLLGDVNADGRAETCLYRNGSFVCDLARDGGAAELKLPLFYKPGGIPLLGDMDGDGRADPCLRWRSYFLCDTAHNGGGAELTFRFGTARDVPVMASRNAEPCIYRDGVFLCDTARNGGAAETRINLRPWLGDLLGQGTPLLGDLDGDGWNDACVFGAGRIVCGLVRPGNRFPVAIIEREIGEPGDRPVLGDIDAF